MTKKVCIYQPNVFPPLHYMQRIYQSDMWVMLDDVQLNKKVGQTQFNIKMNDAKHRISVPVSGGNRVLINEAKISVTDDWLNSTIKTLQHAYHKAPYYHLIESLIIDHIRFHKDLYNDFAFFTEAFTLDLLKSLGWEKEFVSSADLAPELKGSERMAEITKLCEGTHYVCGSAGYMGYIDKGHFRERDVKVLVQDWKCPRYAQQGKGFVANLSVVDAIANMGLTGLKHLLERGGTDEWKEYSF